MRHLLTLIVVVVLVFVAAAVHAESYRQNYDNMAVKDPQDPLLAVRGHATLSLSPMYLEIHNINEASTRSEANLLALVVAAVDEDEALRLVRRLERLETERQLAILKVRVRYARIGDRHELVFQLRQEVLQLLARDVTPLM